MFSGLIFTAAVSGDKDLVIGDPASRPDLYKQEGGRWMHERQI